MYFSNSLFRSGKGALESPCSFCLQKKMLNCAKPFDVTHKAQMAHFNTLGTIVLFEHLLDLQTDLDVKQELHILPLSILTQWSAGLR